MDLDFSGSSLVDLYRQHGDWLRAAVARRLRISPADADDIVQDAYLRIARQPDRQIDRPRALLSQIALNLFRDRRRREAVRSEHARSIQASPPPPSNAELLEQDLALEMERLVLAMPEKMRDVFVLSRFRHMTNQAIADHLGVSIKTVEWRMSRALDFCVRRLRD
ncbi:sigma-70 family RNA polymerase sigma factor [Sphingomonas sp. AP4-R1]|uniref:RNA polymerase sigma factor n=1 Tax=Sphingomonas sp. AP4-R1 TaxID=2735134 RepID=UPI001493BBC6|nr:sigma-70 family RNA polymerase sigma factor [Sphingomonas sp. AP4-R1]QJU60086.1 sigma-70 family RNA polymerase sigma factor [Sphingomonas sp. AP4-R1]